MFKLPSAFVYSYFSPAYIIVITICIEKITYKKSVFLSLRYIYRCRISTYTLKHFPCFFLLSFLLSVTTLNVDTISKFETENINQCFVILRHDCLSRLWGFYFFLCLKMTFQFLIWCFGVQIINYQRRRWNLPLMNDEEKKVCYSKKRVSYV